MRLYDKIIVALSSLVIAITAIVLTPSVYANDCANSEGDSKIKVTNHCGKRVYFVFKGQDSDDFHRERLRRIGKGKSPTMILHCLDCGRRSSPDPGCVIKINFSKALTRDVKLRATRAKVTSNNAAVTFRIGTVSYRKRGRTKKFDVCVPIFDADDGASSIAKPSDYPTVTH